MSDKKQLSEQSSQGGQSSGNDSTNRSNSEPKPRPTTLPEPPSPIMQSSTGEKNFGETVDRSKGSTHKAIISETKDK